MATNYIWDFATDSYLMEKDDSGVTTAVYTNEPVPYGRLVSQRRASTTNYYDFDAQGSTRQLTDQNGNVTDSYTYSAFGEAVDSSGGTANQFQYKGAIGYYSDIGLEQTYVRRRTYGTTVARWMTVDPITSDERLRAHYNVVRPYEYVRLSPLTLVDPSGLDAKDGKCPAPWVCAGFPWQYGCYCGKEPTPARPPATIPPPIDELDKCCQGHDICYGPAPTKAVMTACDKALVACANQVFSHGQCTYPPCAKAYRAIVAYYGP